MTDKYLGDGVYLSNDGYQLWIAANDPSNKTVAMEPEVFEAFIVEGAKMFLGLGAPKQALIDLLEDAILNLQAQ